MDVTYISTSYRDAEYLKACNRSVLRQINVNAMHLIVIDGYESKKLEEFKESKKNCERTVIIQNLNNTGKSACVNQAIQACKSRYIGLLDTDDVLFPEKTEKQLMHLHRETKTAVVGCSYISFLDKNKREMQFIQMPCKIEDAWGQIAFSPTSLYSSLLIDRDRLSSPELDEQLECAMDYAFNLKCLKEGIICNIPGLYCGYRIRSQSITRSSKRINQLINHSKILFNSILRKEDYTSKQIKGLEKMYALGLSVIANDAAEIRNQLKIELNMSQGLMQDTIKSISCRHYRDLDALLMSRVINILAIGAFGRP